MCRISFGADPTDHLDIVILPVSYLQVKTRPWRSLFINFLLWFLLMYVSFARTKKLLTTERVLFHTCWDRMTPHQLQILNSIILLPFPPIIQCMCLESWSFFMSETPNWAAQYTFWLRLGQISILYFRDQNFHFLERI